MYFIAFADMNHSTFILSCLDLFSNQHSTRQNWRYFHMIQHFSLGAVWKYNMA